MRTRFALAMIAMLSMELGYVKAKRADMMQGLVKHTPLSGKRFDLKRKGLLSVS